MGGDNSSERTQQEDVEVVNEGVEEDVVVVAAADVFEPLANVLRSTEENGFKIQ